MTTMYDVTMYDVTMYDVTIYDVTTHVLTHHAYLLLHPGTPHVHSQTTGVGGAKVGGARVGGVTPTMSSRQPGDGEAVSLGQPEEEVQHPVRDTSSG